jgi:hypothetical protein
MQRFSIMYLMGSQHRNHHLTSIQTLNQRDRALWECMRVPARAAKRWCARGALGLATEWQLTALYFVGLRENQSNWQLFMTKLVDGKQWLRDRIYLADLAAQAHRLYG